MRGEGVRLLRITIHSENLRGLSGGPRDAVAVLRELGYLPQVELLETEPSRSPHIEVETFNPKADVVQVQLVSADGERC